MQNIQLRRKQKTDVASYTTAPSDLKQQHPRLVRVHTTCHMFLTKRRSARFFLFSMKISVILLPKNYAECAQLPFHRNFFPAAFDQQFTCK